MRINPVVKVVGIHALLNAAAMAAFTIAHDIMKLHRKGLL